MVWKHLTIALYIYRVWPVSQRVSMGRYHTLAAILCKKVSCPYCVPFSICAFYLNLCWNHQ